MPQDPNNPNGPKEEAPKTEIKKGRVWGKPQKQVPEVDAKPGRVWGKPLETQHISELFDDAKDMAKFQKAMDVLKTSISDQKTTFSGSNQTPAKPKGRDSETQGR